MRRLAERNIETRKRASLRVVKKIRYPCLCVVAVVLSACFPEAEMQFLALSLITGFKWIADSNSRNTNIIIVERS